MSGIRSSAPAPPVKTKVSKESVFLKGQVISPSLSAADINQFNSGRRPGNNVPVIIKVLKIVRKVEEDVEVKVCRVVIIAVAVSDAPCT